MCVCVCLISTPFAPQGWKTGVNGSDLWQMLDQSFGWLSANGYTTKAGAVQKFPIVVGEFGSSLANEKVILQSLPCFCCFAQATALVQFGGHPMSGGRDK